MIGVDENIPHQCHYVYVTGLWGYQLMAEARLDWRTAWNSWVTIGPQLRNMQRSRGQVLIFIDTVLGKITFTHFLHLWYCWRNISRVYKLLVLSTIAYIFLSLSSQWWILFLIIHFKNNNLYTQIQSHRQTCQCTETIIIDHHGCNFEQWHASCCTCIHS